MHTSVHVLLWGSLQSYLFMSIIEGVDNSRAYSLYVITNTTSWTLPIVVISSTRFQTSLVSSNLSSLLLSVSKSLSNCLWRSAFANEKIVHLGQPLYVTSCIKSLNVMRFSLRLWSMVSYIQYLLLYVSTSLVFFANYAVLSHKALGVHGVQLSCICWHTINPPKPILTWGSSDFSICIPLC
jgi:hypothetical protein